jgi:hypothetical protein
MSFDRSRALGLSRHADLKTRAAGTVLVLPERAIRIGGSGTEILALLTGEPDVEHVIAEMSDRHPDSPEIENDVLVFLEEMLALGGIVDRDKSSKNGETA